MGFRLVQIRSGAHTSTFVFSRHRFTSVELCDFIVSAFVSHGEKFIINAALQIERCMAVRVFVCIFYSECITLLLNPHPCKEPKICILMRDRYTCRASVRKLSSNRLCKAARRRHSADPIAVYKLECSTFCATRIFQIILKIFLFPFI